MFWKKKKKPQKTDREQMIAQAKAVAKAKTQEIGEDTLADIRQALVKRESSALEQARKKIIQMDEDKFRDNLKYMLHDKE